MEILIAVAVIAVLVCFLNSNNRKQKEYATIICPNPNCSYRGLGKKDGGTSGCLVLVLLCAGILPGILYLMFAGKPGIRCPRCGMKVR